MSLTQKEKIKLSFAVIFLILSVTIYLTGNFNNEEKHYFHYSNNPDSLATELTSRWKKLPVIHGNIQKKLWGNKVFVAIIFKMSDCGLCLARVHEYIMIIDSLSKNHKIGIICVGTSNKRILLEKFISTLPKSCPVLLEVNHSIRYTHKIYIIDKRVEV